MKPITFNRNSWHYKLVSRVLGEPDEIDTWTDERAPVDLCSYTRKLFICLLFVALGVAVVIGLGIGPMADFLTWVYVGVTVGWGDLDTFGTITAVEMTIVVLAGVSFGIVWLVGKGKEMRRNYRTQNATPDEPSIVHEIYKKFKDKTCVRVDFK